MDTTKIQKRNRFWIARLRTCLRFLSNCNRLEIDFDYGRDDLLHKAMRIFREHLAFSELHLSTVENQKSIPEIAETITAKGYLLNKLFLRKMYSDKHAPKIADSIVFTLSQPDSALADLRIEGGYVVFTEGLDHMAEALRGNKTLTRLAIVSAALESSHVGSNPPAGSMYICGAIRNILKWNRSIIRLDLMDNDITAEGAKLLVEGLLENRLARSVDLGNNYLHDAGAEVVAKAISSEYCAVQSWTLSHNGIEDAGATSIAKGMEKSLCIRELFLDFNRVHRAGAEAIVKAAAKCPAELARVTLSRNMLTGEDTVDLGQLMAKTRQISLDLSENKYVLPTSTSAEARQIQVFVRSLTGETYTITPRLCDRVAEVKVLVQGKSDVAPETQVLVFGGKILQDDHTLFDYNVQEGSTLHLALHLR